MPQNPTTARLEARISTELHAMLKRAAQLQGRTMSDFVIAAVQAASQNVIEQADIIKLTIKDQEQFADSLLNPQPPNSALQKAFELRKKLWVEE